MISYLCVCRQNVFEENLRLVTGKTTIKENTKGIRSCDQRPPVESVPATIQRYLSHWNVRVLVTIAVVVWGCFALGSSQSKITKTDMNLQRDQVTFVPSLSLPKWSKSSCREANQSGKNKKPWLDLLTWAYVRWGDWKHGFSFPPVTRPEPYLSGETVDQSHKTQSQKESKIWSKKQAKTQLISQNTHWGKEEHKLQLINWYQKRSSKIKADGGVTQ